MNGEPYEQREELLHRDETFRIRAAAFEVSRQMGVGFLEAVYHECLALEFTAQGVPFVTGQPLGLTYKGLRLRSLISPTSFASTALSSRSRLSGSWLQSTTRRSSIIFERPACASAFWSTSAARQRRASNGLCSDERPDSVRVFRAFRGQKRLGYLAGRRDFGPQLRQARSLG